MWQPRLDPEIERCGGSTAIPQLEFFDKDGQVVRRSLGAAASLNSKPSPPPYDRLAPPADLAGIGMGRQQAGGEPSPLAGPRKPRLSALSALAPTTATTNRLPPMDRFGSS